MMRILMIIMKKCSRSRDSSSKISILIKIRLLKTLSILIGDIILGRGILLIIKISMTMNRRKGIGRNIKSYY
jgi:hypothetical protein